MAVSTADHKSPTKLAKPAVKLTAPERFILLKQLRKDTSALVGLVLLSVIVVMAVFANQIAPYDPIKTDLLLGLTGPSRDHWLGTDSLGRDMFSRIVHGARWSLGAAAIASLAIVVLGVSIGIIAGFFGGIIDSLLMRLVDVLLAFPSMILALAIVGMLGPSLKNVLIGMVAVWWVDYARIVRGITLRVAQNDYVEAAHCCGCHPTRTMIRHIFPNVIPTVAVLATLELGGLILAISGLSFLGLGAQPPTPEWGAMINDGRAFFLNAPQLMFYPGMAISIVVLACNLVGDGLRDALDPRMRSR
ncbi:MAG: ABC transporter permease [Thermomicrobiales bacterium]|nr:ABC transporter permease [Thermomicrobiales bacterium]MCO5219296.1 ABC transporter permease [Thermomicrobiales bacterium]